MIRTLAKISLYAALGLSLLVSAGMAGMLSPRVQGYIGKKAAEFLSRKLQAEVRVEGAWFRPMQGLVLKNVEIIDLKGHPFVTAKKVIVDFYRFGPGSELYSFRRVLAEDAVVNLVKYAGDSLLNIPRPRKPAPEKNEPFGIGKIQLRVGDLQARNVHFVYQDQNRCGKEKGMDYHFIEVSQIDAQVRDFYFSGDTMQFHISRVKGKERSGLDLLHMEGDFRLGPKGLSGENVLARTPFSSLDCDFRFVSDDWVAWDEFVEKMYLEGTIRESKLNLKDIGPFASMMYEMDNEVRLQGDVFGRIPDLRSKNLSLETGKETRFRGSARLTGLPDIEETFMRIQAKAISATLSDLENIRLQGNLPLSHYLTLPPQLRQLGYVNITGEFTGFYNDFVSNARFMTGLGNVKTDLRLRQETGGRLSYQGQISTQDFFLGKIIDLPESIGKISLDGRIEGQGTDLDDAWMKMDIGIQKISAEGYTYQNSRITGEFQEKQFNGKIRIADPNLKFRFEGMIDLGGDYPEFNFVAQLEEARLEKLGLLSRGDSLVNLVAGIRANFIAPSIDALEGVINLNDLVYTEKGQTYKAGRILLSTSALADGTRSLNLLSDFADADLRGKVFFTRIPATIGIFVSNYLNSFRRQEAPLQEDYSGQSFAYNIHLKNLDMITGLFVPWLNISHHTRFRGHFDSYKRLFNLDGTIDTLTIYGIRMNRFILNGHSQHDRISLHMGCERALFYNAGDEKASGYGIDSLQFVANIRQDSILFSMGWDDKGNSDQNLGMIRGYAGFSQYPTVHVRLTQGKIRINDSLYHIMPDHQITLEPEVLRISRFRLQGARESLFLEGSLGNDSTHRLQALFHNFNLSNADMFLQPSRINPDGVMNGNISFRQMNGKPVLHSDLRVEGFRLNEQDLGHLDFHSEWDPLEEALSLKVTAELKTDQYKYNPLKINGKYYPFDKKRNFDIQLESENFDLRTAEPFTNQVLSKLSGYLTARLKLGGTFIKPDLTGNLKFMRTEFRVKYLNTLYSFSHEINLEPNRVFFRDLVLNDSTGNKAVCQGNITHNYLRGTLFDIKIRPENFILFNTEPAQGKYFHGTGLASGVISVSGPPDKMSINVSATTNRGTEVFIPLTSTIDVQGNDFVYFRQPEGVEKKPENTVSNLDVTGFTLAADMNLTPNARIQISLPQQAGTIESQGEGNISLGINSRGDLSITGDYEIQSGSFLFRIQNILSRLLEIEKGSRIRFPGNPMDAEIDMKASFTTRTTLTGLGLDLDSTLTSIRMPVKSIIHLRNKLINPEIHFSVEFPKLDTDIERMVYTKLDTTNDMLMTQQFVSLLVLNNFSFTMTNKSLGNSIGVSSFQVISNQLSNLLSQISKDFDIGINYRPGDAISSQELEVALRTQLFDERVVIDGNLGVIGDPSSKQTSNVVGDINVEIKLTPDGRLRLKAFNRSNNLELLSVSAPYTQGIGLSYRQEFNNLADLLRRKRKTVLAQPDPGPGGTQ